MVQEWIAVISNDYQIWDSLLEHIPIFGELDKINIMSNHWKRNKFTWNLLEKCAVWNKALQYHTHLVQHCFYSITEQSNSSKTKHHSVWVSEKYLFNFTFLVSTNTSWFHSYLRTPSGYHRMDKNCLNSHCQKKFVFKILFSYFNPRILALVIGSCDPIWNLKAKSIVGWFEQCVCVWQRLPNLW